MINLLSAETRRLVIQYAAAESLEFGVALECLVLEGIKTAATAGASFRPVNKPVQKSL